MYNVLQHVKDPMQVLNTAKAHANTIRIYEWIVPVTSDGHLHILDEDLFRRAFPLMDWHVEIWNNGRLFTEDNLLTCPYIAIYVTRKRKP